MLDSNFAAVNQLSKITFQVQGKGTYVIQNLVGVKVEFGVFHGCRRKV